MRTISDKTEFSLHFVILKERITRSSLPENLDFFCTDTITNEPLTISFRCNDEEWFNKILVLSFKDSGVLNPIKKYSTDGIYGKSGGIELLSEYLLSNFITDVHDPENFGECWVDKNDNELIVDILGDIVLNGKPTGIKAPHIWDEQTEFTFNNTVFNKKFVNNLTLAPDFRNLIQQREYPNYDGDGPLYGHKKFQYNINQTNLKKWIDENNIPEFIFEILNPEQKQLLSKRLSSQIELCSDLILKTVLNQKIEVKNTQTHKNITRDTWGSEMYHSLGGDGEEDIYLSDGVSIRPDGSLTDD